MAQIWSTERREKLGRQKELCEGQLKEKAKHILLHQCMEKTAKAALDRTIYM